MAESPRAGEAKAWQSESLHFTAIVTISNAIVAIPVINYHFHYCYHHCRSSRYHYHHCPNSHRHHHITAVSKSSPSDAKIGRRPEEKSSSLFFTNQIPNDTPTPERSSRMFCFQPAVPSHWLHQVWPDSQRNGVREKQHCRVTFSHFLHRSMCNYSHLWLQSITIIYFSNSTAPHPAQPSTSQTSGPGKIPLRPHGEKNVSK